MANSFSQRVSCNNFPGMTQKFGTERKVYRVSHNFLIFNFLSCIYKIFQKFIIFMFVGSKPYETVRNRSRITVFIIDISERVSAGILSDIKTFSLHTHSSPIKDLLKIVLIDVGVPSGQRLKNKRKEVKLGVTSRQSNAIYSSSLSTILKRFLTRRPLFTRTTKASQIKASILI